MEKIKPWLEILYYLSGPAIAVIAYLALGQIRVAKEQIAEQKKSLQISSKRDALKLTADQVALYCEKIIPLQNIFDQKLKVEDMTILKEFKVEFESGSIKVKPPNESYSFKDFESVTTEFLDVVNALESFSTYFVSGVADEKVAYLSLGSTFCDSMETVSPILILISNDKRQFSAALNLYNIWGTRLESENLVRQKLKIEKKLKSKKQFSTTVLGTDA
ncbi:hypothetical protein KAJ27_22385 [bacterium]|nr:hypothetical protein [bacterium]